MNITSLMKNCNAPLNHLGFLTTPDEERYLPLLHARDLNGEHRTIPTDLPATKRLLLVAFERQQQGAIDSWIDGLALRSLENQIAWIEVPLLQRPWRLLSSWIDHGMRRGITDLELRSHVWTVYADRPLFLKRLGLSSADSIYALVVDREGRVIVSVSGEYSVSNAQIILKALEN
jgi:hypothetical protein